MLLYFCAVLAGTGFEETDFAVFRFTLGIPGFDDALIPRVVGLIGAALLITNHLLDQSEATSAQVDSLCWDCNCKRLWQ